MTTLGAIFPPDLPPERLKSVAVAADDAGLDQLWLWEDCFKESGIATAAAALAWTDRVTIGIGLLPVPLRNVALTAMELATLERLFPGRIVAGVGHGVLSWMEQVGARPQSPMTLLREYTSALEALLHGDSVTTAGRYVTLTDVVLDWPPASAPPLLVGAQRPKTAAVAGGLADGVILTGDTDPATAAELVAIVASEATAAGRPAPTVVTFLDLTGRPSAGQVAETIRPHVEAGATHIAIRCVADDPPLEEFVGWVAGELRAALS